MAKGTYCTTPKPSSAGPVARALTMMACRASGVGHEFAQFACRRTLGRAIVCALAVGLWSGPVLHTAAQAACSSPRNNLYLNPFNKASAHHRPIGVGASFASATHPATVDWLKATLFNVNPGTPFGTHMVETVGTEPLQTIAPLAICDKVIGLPAAIPMPTSGLNTFLQNNTNGCPDGDVVIFDRSASRPHHLRQFQYVNGRPTAGQYRTFDVRGLGHGTRPLQRLGMAASGVAGMFGVLRGHEINTPGYQIEHALRMGLPRKAGCNIMLSQEIVLPATGRDQSATSPGNNTGHIPYGGLLALPRNIHVTALGLSEPGIRLAHAIQRYGIYVGDGGGCGAGALEADQLVDPAIKRTLRNDIIKLHRHVRLVLNNDVLGSPVAGGGTPLGPNCAFDAP